MVAHHPYKFPRSLGWKTEFSSFVKYLEFLKINFFAAKSKVFSEMLRMNI